MTSRARVLAMALITVLVVGAASAYGVVTYLDSRAQRSAPGTATTAPPGTHSAGPRIVFRHTGIDQGYGKVAVVSLADPAGSREFTDVECDRVAASPAGLSCLVTRRGVATTFEARELDNSFDVLSTHPLPGVPSRTRLSDDGTLVATTSFVTGHSYMSTGFSTETVVRETGAGHDWGNLEDFTLVLEGRTVRPTDRNVWGVTFAGGHRFYATVGTGGRTWLVAGDLDTRTLTSVVDGAECPALSPDGTRVAFKVDVDAGPEKVWGLAVHDLATGERTVLRNGPRAVDDQVAWLDDSTLMYGLPRTDDTGVTDVWEISAEADAEPHLLIAQAWSPTVVEP